jgi:hypothetical protein
MLIQMQIDIYHMLHLAGDAGLDDFTDVDVCVC